MKFSITDSPISVIKSEGTVDFVTFTEKIFNGKLFVECKLTYSGLSSRLQ